jgi:hypothetical protein
LYVTLNRAHCQIESRQERYLKPKSPENVIDTVDKGLENEIAKFLEKKILRGKNSGYGVNT